MGKLVLVVPETYRLGSPLSTTNPSFCIWSLVEPGDPQKAKPPYHPLALAPYGQGLMLQFPKTVGQRSKWPALMLLVETSWAKLNSSGCPKVTFCACWGFGGGLMLPQRGQLPSTEKREAETQCLQCQDVTAHTFMGCQTSSQGHTVPISNSLSMHLQSPVHYSDQ